MEIYCFVCYALAVCIAVFKQIYLWKLYESVYFCIAWMVLDLILLAVYAPILEPWRIFK